MSLISGVIGYGFLITTMIKDNDKNNIRLELCVKQPIEAIFYNVKLHWFVRIGVVKIQQPGVVKICTDETGRNYIIVCITKPHNVHSNNCFGFLVIIASHWSVKIGGFP